MKPIFAVTLFVILLSPLGALKAAETSALLPNPERMPAFSWDRVPLYVHIRKDTAFTDEEIKYLSTFPIIAFEKATGHTDSGSVEAGTLKAARAVKEINPNTKILYYRNVIVHYGGYAANAELKNIPDAFLVDSNGNNKLIRNRVQAYDLSNKAVRDWWIDAAKEVCSDPAIDGVFLDGVVKVLEPVFLKGVITPEKKAAELAGYVTMMEDTRKVLGPQKLMLSNILRARFADSGLSYLKSLDGSYIEGFEGAVGMSKKDYVAKGMEAFQQAAQQGSIVAYTCGLGSNQQDADETPRPAAGNTNAGGDAVANPARRGRNTQDRFDYQLAIFLVCAEKYSYFDLKDGYDAKTSKTWLTHPEIYDRPLGAPKGPAVRDGYTYTRDFEHVSVQLDIENETASIVWKVETHAADIYVAQDGSDTNPGTSGQPLASLVAAQNMVRKAAVSEAVTVHVADGIYYLPETLTFTPEDSGTETKPVVYRAVNEGRAVLSGGSRLNLDWEPYQHGIFQSKTPAGLDVDQLFINGKNQRMARYPNYDATKKTDAYQGYAADAFSTKRAANWADPSGGYIHAMHSKRWGGYHYLITGKNASGEVTYEGGWQNNRQMGMHNEFRMVENIFEELDAPGEWFHNAKTSTLYYMPESGADLSNATVEVVRLRHLIEFQGSEIEPVEYITLKGFVVRHAARTFMDTKEPMLRSDWAIYRGGAYFLTGTQHIQILDTEFDQVGGNAIFVNNYNRNTLVKGCHIHDCGASGVCFVGDPDAVRDPLFEYRETNDLTKIDRTPGPKTNNYPSLGTVDDCLIHGIGRVERQPAGVMMDMASEITVRDCSVYDCARAGINIGDGAWGGHLIERCDVFDTVLETHDHGSFNSWGRDRYWHSNRDISQAEIDSNPDLPFLDAVKTTTIRDNRWRCDHGWDIDLDDGSSNYDIYNNLMLSGGLKLREGFRRHAWNNIAVNNTFHPHVWYANSNDEVYGNIFMGTYKGVRAPSKTAIGKRVGGNLIFGGNLTKEFGWDEGSIVADPLFVDPANGDFRVKPGSPALKLGFKNFPMDQFGVKKPSLKAIARTPVIPALKVSQGRTGIASVRTTTWLGATLSDLSGEEFSAYGVSRDEAGVAVLSVKQRSEASSAGLLKGDLIQRANGRATVNINQFNRAVGRTSGILTLKVVRDQQEIEVKVSIPRN